MGIASRGRGVVPLLSKESLVSAAIIGGFFLFWIGEVVLAGSLLVALSRRTNGAAIVILGGGVATSSIMMLVGTATGFYPVGASAIAYVTIGAVAWSTKTAFKKPKENQSATTSNR